MKKIFTLPLLIGFIAASNVTLAEGFIYHEELYSHDSAQGAESVATNRIGRLSSEQTRETNSMFQFFSEVDSGSTLQRIDMGVMEVMPSKQTQPVEVEFDFMEINV